MSKEKGEGPTINESPEANESELAKALREKKAQLAKATDRELPKAPLPDDTSDIIGQLQRNVQKVYQEEDEVESSPEEADEWALEEENELQDEALQSSEVTNKDDSPQEGNQKTENQNFIHQRILTADEEKKITQELKQKIAEENRIQRELRQKQAEDNANFAQIMAKRREAFADEDELTTPKTAEPKTEQPKVDVLKAQTPEVPPPAPPPPSRPEVEPPQGPPEIIPPQKPDVPQPPVEPPPAPPPPNPPEVEPPQGPPEIIPPLEPDPSLPDISDQTLVEEQDIAEMAKKVGVVKPLTAQAPKPIGPTSASFVSDSNYDELKALVTDKARCDGLNLKNLKHPVKENQLSFKDTLPLQFTNSETAYAQRAANSAVTYSAKKNLSIQEWETMAKNAVNIAVANSQGKEGITFDISYVQSPEKQKILENAFHEAIEKQNFPVDKRPKVITSEAQKSKKTTPSTTV